MTIENLNSAQGQSQNIALLAMIKAAVEASSSNKLIIELDSDKLIIISDGLLGFLDGDIDKGQIPLWPALGSMDFLGDINGEVITHLETLTAAFAAITYSEP